MNKQTKPEVTLGKHRNNQLGDAHVSMDFYNHTGRPVTIIYRNGTTSSISPKVGPEGTNGKFFITITKRVNGGGVISRTIDQLEDNEIETRLYNEWTNDINGSDREISFTYTIDNKEIDVTDGYYLEKLDVLLAFSSRTYTPPHPRTIAKVKESLGTTAVNVTGLQHVIFVNDTRGDFRTRYVNLYGIILPVTAVNSPLHPDGIYVTICMPNGRTEAMRYDIDGEDCKIRFYNTPGEAANNGDELKRLEEEFKTFQAKAKLREAELIAEQEDMKLKLQEEARRKEAHYKDEERRREREAKQFDLQAKATLDSYSRTASVLDDHRSREQSRRKDHYETASMNRKSTLDIAKSVPSIFTIIGNLFK